jgi:hypothetical protein
MVVICTSCGKRHNIPFRLYEDRFRGRMVVIGCKQCGVDIRVDGTERTSNPPPRPPSTAPKPRLTPVTKYVGVTSAASGREPSARAADKAPTARRSIQPPDELGWFAGGGPDAAPGAAVGQPAAAESETPWVLLLPDASNRELSLPDLLKALRGGEVSTGNLVWRAGMPEWRPISQVPELTPYLDSLQEDEPTRNEGPKSKKW